jgi:hypothetical protein
VAACLLSELLPSPHFEGPHMASPQGMALAGSFSCSPRTVLDKTSGRLSKESRPASGRFVATRHYEALPSCITHDNAPLPYLTIDPTAAFLQISETSRQHHFRSSMTYPASTTKASIKYPLNIINILTWTTALLAAVSSTAFSSCRSRSLLFRLTPWTFAGLEKQYLLRRHHFGS